MKTSAAAVAVLAFAAAPLSMGEVIITEIMYNPDSQEGFFAKAGQPATPTRTEWVEIYNTGDEAVDLGGWMLKDDDGEMSTLPSDAKLEPKTAAVLVPNTINAGEFAEAWGKGFDVYPVGPWAEDGMKNLANNPEPGKEIVSLVDAEGNVVDEVAYDDEGDWPSDSPDGPSIYLDAKALTAKDNDRGDMWHRSTEGEAGAFMNEMTSIFDGKDVGSPGVVATEDPE